MSPAEAPSARPPLLEVGRIVRPHGLFGEVVVELSTNRMERLAPGAELRTEEAVLRVLRSRPAGSDGRFLTGFEGVADRSVAEELRSAVLYAYPLDDPAELWVHELIGSRVFETDGTCRGRVEAVQANPASDILLLDSGALVPLTFVLSASEGRIEVDVPSGLFE